MKRVIKPFPAEILISSNDLRAAADVIAAQTQIALKRAGKQDDWIVSLRSTEIPNRWDVIATYRAELGFLRDVLDGIQPLVVVEGDVVKLERR